MADTRATLSSKVDLAREEARANARPVLVLTPRITALADALADRLSTTPVQAVEDALQRALDDLPAPSSQATPEAPAAVSEPRGRVRLKATERRLEEASRKPSKSKLRR